MTDSDTQAGQCTVCASPKTNRFAEIPRVPVLCNILWEDQADAISVQRVTMQLAYCNNCGHIFNPTFDLGLLDYSQEYENSLHYSPRFQQYAEGLAKDLAERHQLQGKEIIEIGSGKGDFLEMICELGDNHGTGFDPSYVPGETERSKTEQIDFVQDFYSEQYTDRHVDFVACRHTLEHIEDPIQFMQMVRRTVGDNDTTIFFEVPNGLYTLQQMAIWDIIYEHCSLFTEHSLTYLFEHAGFDVNDVRTTFGGQYLCIEAKPKRQSNELEQPTTMGQNGHLDGIHQDVQQFAQRYVQKTEDEGRLLHEMNEDGQKVVVWGAGSKGITFLNLLDGADRIRYAVDLNPRKQGMFITGTGQQIVSPDFLAEYRPDAVIVMNPLYMGEIQQSVHEMGLAPQFLTA